jgi:PIN domain nuclease of toxin-antitoxin system
MRALLDTSVFLWVIDGSEKLSLAAREVIEDQNNDLFLSTVSIWEILLKAGKGKLLTDMSVEQQVLFLRTHVANLQLNILAVEMAHVLAVASLPVLHRDPFDRLLLTQARVENLVLISGDAAVRAYGGDILW